MVLGDVEGDEGVRVAIHGPPSAPTAHRVELYNGHPANMAGYGAEAERVFRGLR